MPLELVVGDIHLVAEEEVELGDGGQVEEDAVGNEADVILSTLTARLCSNGLSIISHGNRKY